MHIQTKRLTARIAMALVAVAASTAFAQPAQKPLLSQSGEVPIPNVMLTLDSSWSMNWSNMPEGTFQVNGVNVTLPAVSIIIHPDDPFYEPGAIWGTNNNDNDTGVLISDPNTVNATERVYQAQMRSSDVNGIYYNPKVVYQPWPTIDDKGVVGRLPPAPPTAAPFHPLRPTEGTADLQDNNRVLSTRKWCRAVGNNCLTNNPVSRTFQAGVYYVLTAGANPTQIGSYTRYNINAATSFPKAATRTDCTGTTCNQAEERQNFANWFTYYRTRLLLAQASIPDAFINMPENKIRLGWGSIHQQSTNQNNVDGVNSAIVQQGVRPMDLNVKRAMLNWMRTANNRNNMTGAAPSGTLRLWGGTPLRVATAGVGDYFSRTDARNPWANNPAASDGGGPADQNASCRRSFNILVTDGYWNENYNTNTVGNYDNTSRTLPSQTITSNATPPLPSFNYAAINPYKDNNSNMVADVAMRYWNRDLRPDVPNKVNATTENPAFWQHLVQFTVGLGVKGTLNPETDLPALTNGTLSWGSDKIDDLWHAAVNTHGRYFSARNSQELAAAISTALGKASANEGLKEGGVATASNQLVADNVKYIPSYATVEWTGEIEAYPLNDDGVVSSTVPTWRATERMPATAGARNIFTYNGTNAVPFLWASMGTVLQGEMTGGSANLVNYLRGDKTNEGTAASNYRVRKGPLPDFINSTPAFIQSNVDMGYAAALPVAQGGGNAYTQFLADKAARTPLLAVGGNGGMLHIFQTQATTSPAVPAGRETFAFVPRTVLPNLSKLADKTYGTPGNYHQYFVDGGLAEGDYYNGSAWRNILVGTLGAGGRAIYALDLTTTTGLNASTVMWEKSSSNDTDIGYIMSDAEVGVLQNGSWKVFVGNGYDSNAGRAVLLVIDVATGDIQKIVADTSGSNGLSGVRLVRNASQQVIAAYAGDLKGNMWRFEFGDGAVASWRVGFGGLPLIVARDPSGTRQPITATPSFVPAVGNGNVVIFATGKLLVEADQTTTQVQTAYGITDPTTGLYTTLPTPLPDSAGGVRGSLTQQTIGAATTTAGGTYYTISSNVPAASSKGWYLDLSIQDGQRSVYPTIEIGDFVYISSIVPAGSAAQCESSSGRGFNFLLNARTGQQYNLPVLDTNGDGVINSNDDASAGFLTGADGGDTPLTKIIGPKDKDKKVSFQNTRGQQRGRVYCIVNCEDPVDPEPPTPGPTKIKDRVWRQLINPPHP